jgi:hypothetical protein
MKTGALLPVDKLHMRERKVSNFAVEFALPQAVDRHLGHLHDVSHLGGDKKKGQGT